MSDTTVINLLVNDALSDIKIVDNCLASEQLGIYSDRFYVLCPCSIGDTLFVLCMLKSYLEHIGNKRKVCIIVKKTHREIPRWLDEEWEVFCSDEITFTLNMYSVLFGVWKLDNYLYGHFKKKNDFLSKGDGYNWVDPEGEINIVSRYSKMIFDMEKCSIDFPNYQNIYSKKNIYNISKKSVVFMPYAQTAIQIPMVFWEKLAELLVKRGYDVITNVKDDTEKAITGTRPLCISIEDMIKVSHEALAVVSLRSGMCDVLAFCDVILFVLNTSEELHIEWDVRTVNNREGIINFLVTQNNLGEVFRQ